MLEETHLQFLGAAGTVTGAKFLVTTGGARVMIDCGLFQGLKNLRERNWTHLPVPPSSIDAVVLTHAHLDHSGYVPLLVRNGFRGEVLCTHATRRLCEIVLPDSGKLQEEEASYAERHSFSKHHPPRALYTEEDARTSLAALRGLKFGERIEIAPDISIEMQPAGHILGSASVTLHAGARTILFSGDLGRTTHPLLRPPAPPSDADVIVVESTYGDSLHEDRSWLDRFAATINRTAERGGTVVIPAFAVDRTEEVLFHLRASMRSGAIPRLTVFVDSPMALEALRVYRRALAAHDPDVRDGMTPDVFDTGTLVEARTEQQSRAINEAPSPKIIVSASGMATGGRVLHHLARLLPDPRTTLVLPGYQALGTRGRALATGVREVRIFGRQVPVRAEVTVLDALSSHADRDEIASWLGAARRAPHTCFVVHGESEASDALTSYVHEKLSWNVRVARHFERVRIE